MLVTGIAFLFFQLFCQSLITRVLYAWAFIMSLQWCSVKTSILESNSSVMLPAESVIKNFWNFTKLENTSRYKFCPDSFRIMTLQQGSMFQNSETLPSEKKYIIYTYLIWSKVIVLDFYIFTASCTWYTSSNLFDSILRWEHHNMGLDFQHIEKIIS